MYSGSPGREWLEVGRRQSSSVSESHCEEGKMGPEMTRSQNTKVT